MLKSEAELGHPATYSMVMAALPGITVHRAPHSAVYFRDFF